MSVLTLIFGLLSGCFLSVLVGIIGSRRRIGFGWAFLLSVIFTPLVGLVIALPTRCRAATSGGGASEPSSPCWACCSSRLSCFCC